ncbi:MAG: NUDIX domain-containing protein [Candidatus Nanohaloarchaea archaeon]|nr:NUDIX domain-containing protein [Candidatus Nanohaloarchaea archaeon]
MEWQYCPVCGDALDGTVVEGRERRYCPSCDHVYWRNPKPVAWLLAQHGDRYLLVKRAHPPDTGTWDIPGGFLEHGESFPAAAAREFEEECGVPADSDALDLHTTLSFGRADENVVGAVFHAELEDAVDPVPGDEVSDAQWWRLDQLTASDETVRDVCIPVFEEEKDR